MPNTGTIRGTHHLTFCVGGAQEDYDFHVRILGLKLVKKTVLFDGEIPIYHLYYGNRTGDGSTLLTSFPYRQAGLQGKRGTNQARDLNLVVPTEALGFWADRLRSFAIEVSEVERFGTARLEFDHPCGIHYAIIADGDADDREPWTQGGIEAQHAIRGAHGTTTSVRDVDPMHYFITEGMRGERLASEGPRHQYRIGTDEGNGRILELLEEPDLPQGTWQFGEGTIHHHAFDVGSSENQLAVKDWIVGLGFTDASEPKDRGYFYSVYCRSPSGLLVELAYSTPQGFLVDEAEDELGTTVCIPPHWEERRPEIDQLEPIETVAPVA
jgi:glyoxalase family protein